MVLLDLVLLAAEDTVPNACLYLQAFLSLLPISRIMHYLEVSHPGSISIVEILVQESFTCCLEHPVGDKCHERCGYLIELHLLSEPLRLLALPCYLAQDCYREYTCAC